MSLNFQTYWVNSSISVRRNLFFRSDCCKVSSVVSVFKNVGERSNTQNCRPVILPSVVSTFFEKLVNNRLVDYLEKFGLFYDFHKGFGSFGSIEDLLTVASE